MLFGPEDVLALIGFFPRRVHGMLDEVEAAIPVLPGVVPVAVERPRSTPTCRKGRGEASTVPGVPIARCVEVEILHARSPARRCDDAARAPLIDDVLVAEGRITLALCPCGPTARPPHRGPA